MLDLVVSVVFVALLAVSAITAIVARVRSGRRLGFGGGAGAVVPVGQGLLISGAVMTALVLTIVAVTPTTFGPLRLDAGRLWLSLAVLVLAAVGEEAVYRALLLNGLATLTRRPALALVVSAVVFGLVHRTGSAHVTWVAVVGTSLGGFAYGLAYLRTGTIWLSVGVHLGWNVVQGTIWGYPVSDEVHYSGALWHPVIAGSSALTGAAYGPEASVLSLAARAAIILAVLAAVRSSSARVRGSRTAARGLPPVRDTAWSRVDDGV